MKKKLDRLSRAFDIPVLDPKDARRRKLLNVMLGASAIGASIALIIVLLAVPTGILVGSRPEIQALCLASAFALVGAAILYVINRYVSGELASVLFILLLLALTALSDEPQQVSNGRGLFLFAIPIVAASVLLRPWASFVAAGLSSLVLVLMAMRIVDALPNIPGMLVFFMLATVTWLSAWSLERALERLYAANAALRENEERLEDMVSERTQKLRETQEQLLRQEKLAVLGQMAGGVAHELRNPLGAIKNSAYYLNMVLEDVEPEVKEVLGIMEKEVGTCNKIITSLLDFARIKFPARQKVDVNDLLQTVLARVSIPGNVELVYELEEDLPAILVDPDQLELVFGNLVLNAIQAMTLLPLTNSGRKAKTPKGGRLNIQSQVSSQWVAVSIGDTGTGISDENLAKVFEPFFSTKAKGIGLGLALTRDLVDLNKGSIEVQSQVGQGSTFTVRLPRAE